MLRHLLMRLVLPLRFSNYKLELTVLVVLIHSLKIWIYNIYIYRANQACSDSANESHDWDAYMMH